MTARTQNLERLYADYPWWDLQANDHIIMQTAADPLAFDSLVSAALGNADRLAVVQTWETAWSEFVTRHPEFANRKQNKLLAFQKADQYASSVKEVFASLVDVAALVPCPLVRSAAAIAQEQDQKIRRDLIQEISEGKTVYTARDRYGRVSRYQSADLENDTTERLQEIRNFVVGQRKLLAMSPGQAREAVKRIQKTQTEAAQAPSLTLINPETNLEYTRRELVRLMAAQDKATFRKMLFTNNGQPIPGAKEAVDRILGVKPLEQPGQRFGVKI
jgi:hypothetical protein